jgi:hypothetical protein
MYTFGLSKVNALLLGVAGRTKLTPFWGIHLSYFLSQVLTFLPEGLAYTVKKRLLGNQ